MNVYEQGAKPQRDALNLAIWENDEETQRPQGAEPYYGRRLEADRTWSVYDVYTGAPVTIDGLLLTSLSRSDATARMLTLNHRNAERKTRPDFLSSSLYSAIERQP